MNVLELLFNAAKAALDIMEKLEGYPVKWVATFNGQPVTLIGLAWRYDRPLPRWQVRYRDADGTEHVIVALHDFDGKPADVLTLDGAALPDGDMDVIYLFFRHILRLQWEWGGNRLRLDTDLRDDPNGLELVKWIEGE